MSSELDYLTPEDLEEARRNGIDERLAKERFYHYNWPKEEAITTPKGQRRKSLYVQYRDIALSKGLSKAGFYYRVRIRGMGLKEAATLPNERVRNDQKLFREWSKVAEQNNIHPSTFHSRVVRYKWSYERAATEPVGSVIGRPKGPEKVLSKRKSKYKGVYWHAPISKWVSRFNHLGKLFYLGQFNTEEEAHAAYVKKRKGMGLKCE